MAEEHRIEGLGVSVVVTESAADDGAIVVFVDTDFEPDASDGGRGMRVLLNDEPVYTGVACGDNEATGAQDPSWKTR